MATVKTAKGSHKLHRPDAPLGSVLASAQFGPASVLAARHAAYHNAVSSELHMAFVSVLVVDDDADASASARAVLSAAGYAVHEALSVRRALQRLMASPPDVMITEILLQDGDGIELISAAKETSRDTRIIAVAKRRFLYGLDLLDLASKLGADAVLEKPLEPGTLLATVGRVVALDARQV